MKQMREKKRTAQDWVVGSFKQDHYLDGDPHKL